MQPLVLIIQTGHRGLIKDDDGAGIPTVHRCSRACQRMLERAMDIDSALVGSLAGRSVESRRQGEGHRDGHLSQDRDQVLSALPYGAVAEIAHS